MSWSFHVEPGGLVWPDTGSGMPQLKEALEDCVESLSPNGTVPALSTYWIDRALARSTSEALSDAVIASGNEWTLRRAGDLVEVQWQYDDAEDDEPNENLGVADLKAGLDAYRKVVARSINEGHQLDSRRWVQRNPG